MSEKLISEIKLQSIFFLITLKYLAELHGIRIGSKIISDLGQKEF